MDRFTLLDTDENITSTDVEHSFLDDDEDLSDAEALSSDEEDAFAGKNNKFSRSIVVICCYTVVVVVCVCVCVYIY